LNPFVLLFAPFVPLIILTILLNLHLKTYYHKKEENEKSISLLSGNRLFHRNIRPDLQPGK
jgi:hypothetical protein